MRAGYTPYCTAIPAALGSRIDYGQVVKVYGLPQEGQKRYSPAMKINCTKKVLSGNPDMDNICTSPSSARTAVAFCWKVRTKDNSRLVNNLEAPAR